MVDRQQLFGGTEPVAPHLSLDVEKLGAYLVPRLAGLGGGFAVEKFKGGQSNPTYKLIGRDRTYVLRRKPPGHLLASAHAIDREYRVIQALATADYPVPHPHVYCEDLSVIGSEFYIVDNIEGRVVWDAELPEMTADDRAQIYDEMNALLSRLHCLDYAGLSLSSFGRIGDYTARNLKRWSRIYEQSKLVEIPDMEWLAAALIERVPATEPATLIHGDFGLYNVILHPSEPRILAVIDWEMSTLGNPYIDLAHNVRAWWDLPDPVHGGATSLRGRDLPQLGIPSMDRYMTLYGERTGLKPLTPAERDFYLGFAQFRYAAMIQGILKRAAEGSNANRTVLQTQARVVEIAAISRRTLQEHSA